MTTKFTKTQQAAIAAAEAALDRTPWTLTIKTGRDHLLALVITDRTRGEPEAYTPITYRTLKACRMPVQDILSRVHDKLGRPLELNTLIDDRIAFRGTLPLDEETGQKLALFAVLACGIRDQARIELLALRLRRFTREEASYWLGRATSPIYGQKSVSWAQTGLRVMLAGQPGDQDAIYAAMDRLRYWY